MIYHTLACQVFSRNLFYFETISGCGRIRCWPADQSGWKWFPKGAPRTNPWGGTLRQVGMELEQYAQPSRISAQLHRCRDFWDESTMGVCGDVLFVLLLAYWGSLELFYQLPSLVSVTVCTSEREKREMEKREGRERVTERFRIREEWWNLWTSTIFRDWKRTCW